MDCMKKACLESGTDPPTETKETITPTPPSNPIQNKPVSIHIPGEQCHRNNSRPDPRGDGAVLDDSGQPNIIDYSDKNPFLHSTSLGPNQAGLIILNNEPDRMSPSFMGPRPGNQVLHGSGAGSVGETIQYKPKEDDTYLTGGGTTVIPMKEAWTDNSRCGNCENFVKGGRCKLVRGYIDPVEGYCKFYEKGAVNPSETETEPEYSKAEAAYTEDDDNDLELSENVVDPMIIKNEAAKLLNTTNLDASEIKIILDKEFPGKLPETKPPKDVNDSWSQKPEDKILFRTDQANGPYLPTSEGITLLQATPQFDEATYGVSGNVTETIKLKKFLKYKYNPDPENPDCKICKPLNGSVWDNDDKRRPILPSEKLGEGLFNTHPHCRCTWEEVPDIVESEDEDVFKPTKRGKELGKAATSSAKERARITNKYFRRLAFDPADGNYTWKLKGEEKETITSLHEAEIPGLQKEAFEWITPEALKELYAAPEGGKFLLVIAAGPGVTDHRSEGEKFRRLITPDLVKKMTYTGIGKNLDINHEYPKKDPESGQIFDAEYNPKTQKMEMIVWESDQEILNSIRKGIITAVSINAGKPRTTDVKCTDTECFLVPNGTILGEGSGIGLTWVVTNPSGMMYNGKFIPPTRPGFAITKIYILE